MRKSIGYHISFALMAVLLIACFQSDYTKLVKIELGKGVRQDSILLGIFFGDTREDFYRKCLDLNKQKLVTQGSGGLKIQYLFKDSLLYKDSLQISFLFSPSFDDNDVISEMNYEFSYTAWAPWNRQLQPDSLRPKVLKIMTDWYKGNEFITAIVDGNEIPVKLDCNRRLTVYANDAQNVIVKVQDILHPMFKHSITTKRKMKTENQSK
jgi:hypothetical protein